MRRLIVTLAIISSITVGLCLYFSQRPAQAVPDAYISHSYTPEALVTILNRIRAENGSKPLKLDPRLNQSAQRKADEMNNDGIDVNNPHVNKAGIHGYQYAQELVPECKLPSENVLWDTHDAKSGFSWWMDSPPHRKAMLSDQWEITGFGIKDGYIVNHFCDII